MNVARLDFAPALQRLLAAVAAHPLLERLFFASLELAVLALLVFAAIRIGRIRSPRLAALLWLLVLGKPLVSLAVGSPFHLFRMEVPAAVVEAPAPLAPAAHTDPQPSFATSSSSSIDVQSPPEPIVVEEEMAGAPFAPLHEKATPTPATPQVTPTAAVQAPPTRTSPPWSPATWILGIWLTGVAFFAGLSLVDRARAWRLVRAARKPEPGLSNRYSALAANMGLKRPAALWITDEMESPALVGSIFSTIVIPGWLADDANEAKLDWALRHELMHFRLRDPWAALVRELSQMLFYFHPVAWWAGAKWKTATEKACDRAIVADEAAARDYAEQLYRILVGIHGRRQAALRTGLFATRTQIGQRIAALLYGPRTAPHLSAVALVAVALVTAVTLSVGGAFADKNAKPDDPEKTPLVAAADKAAEPQPAPVSVATESKPESAPAPAPDVTFTYTGTVVDDHGKPVAGAKISLDYWHAASPTGPVPTLAVTDSKGRFEFSRHKRDFAGADRWGRWWFPAMIMATKPGYGPAGGQAIEFETTGRLVAEQHQPPGWHPKDWSNVLKLASDDVPIHGRILDTEGRPVVGALVQALNLWEGRDGSLDTWEVATRRPGADLKGLEEKIRPINFSNRLTAPYPTLAPAVRTDANGWFTLAGLGRERLADLAVSGPGIETTPLHVRTRRGAVIKVLPDRRNPKSGQETFYPCDFTRVAGPSVTVEGQVTDGKSHQPLAGIRVHAARIISWPFRDDDLARRLISATTDAGGHYRLEGLPPGFARLGVIPPPGSRYLMAGVDVRIGMQRSPLAVDIKLGAGVMVHGRVTDSRTGMPAQGSLQYFAFWTNPHLKEAPGFGISGFIVSQSICNYRCAADGRFELPVLPGPGILAFRADRGSQFPEAIGAADIHGPKGQNGGEFSTAPYDCGVEFFHLLTPLNPQPGIDSLALDLTVRSPATVTGTVRGPDGKPLSHYSLSDKSSFLEEASRWGRQRGAISEINGATFKLNVYSPADHQRLVFYQHSRNLGSFLEFTGEPAAPLDITLQPCATLQGRVVDDGGQPLEEVSLVISARQAIARENRAAESREAAAATGPQLDQSQITTDKDGRFELRGVVPGFAYSAVAQGAITSRAGRRVPGGAVFSNIVARAGETKDLGDLPIVAEVKAAAEPAKAKVDQSHRNAARGRAAEPVAFAEGRRSGAETAAAADVTFTYAGTVVDEHDQPVAGAKIALDYWRANIPAGGVPPLAVSDERGQFRFSRRKSDFWNGGPQIQWWRNAMILATKEGFGLAGARSVRFETTGELAAELRRETKLVPETGPKVLKLVSDNVTIRGRILDLDGRAVSGALVRAINVWEAPEGNLKTWEAAARMPDADYWELPRKLRTLSFSHILIGERPSLVPEVRTDASGWFTLHGIGPERLADLVISGPAIETMVLHVRTRQGDLIKLPHKPNQFLVEAAYYPCEFTRAAGPSVAVEGRVTDRESRRPLAGMELRVDRIGIKPPFGTLPAQYLSATTDTAGHYRLEGLPLGPARFSVIPPVGSRYLQAGFDVDTHISQKPVATDVQLRAGVPVRGRVVDERTGLPVTGSLEYFAYRTNPHLQEARGFESRTSLGPEFHYRANENGVFEIPVLPGKGILAFRADSFRMFHRGAGANRIDAPQQSTPDSTSFVTAPTYCRAEQHHLLTPIDPHPGADSMTLDLMLRSGVTVKGKVLDERGKPLSDYHVFCGTSLPLWSWNKGEMFEVEGYYPTEHRRLMFYHPGRNLVGLYELTGSPTGDLEIKLHPGATITGRVVDSAGQPLENALINNLSNQMNSPEKGAAGALPGVLLTYLDDHFVKTDKQGRFELSGIIPGLKYSASARGTSGRGARPIFKDVTAEAGETKELGDLKLTQRDASAAKEPSQAPAKATVDLGDTKLKRRNSVSAAARTNAVPENPLLSKVKNVAEVNEVHGRVLLPDGKPAAGARVFALRRFWSARIPRSPLDKTTAKPDGTFVLRFPKDRPYDGFGVAGNFAIIAAQAEGFGPDWRSWLPRTGATEEVVLKLVADSLIHGRIVDLEGKPVAGAQVSWRWQNTPRPTMASCLAAIKSGDVVFRQTGNGGELPAYDDESKPPAVTDIDGRFTVKGIGADHMARLELRGETIAYAEIDVVNHAIEPIRYQNRFDVAGRLFGSDFTYQAAPTQPLMGTVRDAASGAPLAGVSIESRRLAGAPGAEDGAVRTQTDAQGRYRLVGLQKASGDGNNDRNVISVIPNDEQPYFMLNQVRVPKIPGLAPATLDFKLTRGLWITGRATDKVTGKPAPCRLIYAPFLSNSLAANLPEFKQGRGGHGSDLTRYMARPDGTFRIVGLPGRGLVAAKSMGRLYSLSGGATAGMTKRRKFPTYLSNETSGMNVVEEINPAPGTESVARDLVFDPGRTVRLTVVDGDGKPVGRCLYAFSEIGGGAPIGWSQNATIEMAGMAPEESRHVLIHDRERHLGKVIVFRDDKKASQVRTVTLEPCAILKGRFVDADGVPVKNVNLEPGARGDGYWLGETGMNRSDADGKFQLDLPPGAEYYTIWAGGFGNIAEKLLVSAGKTIDLGDIKVKPDK